MFSLRLTEPRFLKYPALVFIPHEATVSRTAFVSKPRRKSVVEGRRSAEAPSQLMNPGGAAVMRLGGRSLHGHSASDGQLRPSASGYRHSQMMQQLMHKLPESLRQKFKKKKLVGSCDLRDAVLRLRSFRRLCSDLRGQRVSRVLRLNFPEEEPRETTDPL